jgi:hypothetical protein
MGSPPLAALQIRPPEDPLSMFIHATQVQNLMTQGHMQQIGLQEAQLDLADQYKMRSAWADSNGDPEQYIKNLGKQQVNPKTVIGQQQLMLQMQKNHADLDEVTLKNNAARSDAYRGRILSIVGGPEAEKQQAWDAELTREEQAGAIQPGMWSHTYPGDDVATSAANHFALGSVLAKEAYENKTAAAKTSEAATAAQRLAIETPGIQSRGVVAGQEAAMSPQARALAGNLPYAAATGVPGAQQALSLETQQKREAAIAQVQAQAQMYASNSALAKVPPHLVPAATSEATKLATDFAGAKQAADSMSAFLGMALGGNKEAVRIVPLQGALEITTAQGVHRINRTEVDQYGSAGSIFDKILGSIGGAVSGKNIPDTVLRDMQSLQQVVANSAEAKYKNGLKAVNQNYGSNFQPVQMNEGVGNVQGGGAVDVTDPRGVTHRFPNQQAADAYKRDAGIR